MATATKRITAEEYLNMDTDGQHCELVRGRIEVMNMPTPRHGQICGNIYFLLRQFTQKHRLGHVVSNDSGVITERDDDTVRGPDIAFYSFKSVKPGRMPPGYIPVPPDLAAEVRSTTDRWSRINKKVREYLDAGVKVVFVADQQTESVYVHRDDDAPEIYRADDTLRLPDVLPGFKVKVFRFFE